MKRIAALILILMSSAAPLSQAANDEFFITCDAPVLVGAGIIRCFSNDGTGRLSVKYSYGGRDGDTVLIEKLTVGPGGIPRMTETIRVPLTGLGRTGRLDISEHSLELKMNGDGRLIVKEIKG